MTAGVPAGARSPEAAGPGAAVAKPGDPDPGHAMALLAEGDWWEYEVHGSAERGGVALPLAGSVRVEVRRRQAAGRGFLALVFAPAYRVAGVDGPAGDFPAPAGVFYFEQDARTRDVLIAGDNMGPAGADRFARVPQLFYPGRFDAATAYDNVLDFGEHGSVANTLCTEGAEWVDTGLGRLAAWRAPIVSRSEAFGEVRGCDWWCPALGAPLRFEMTATAPDGSRLQTAAVLRAASRAPA